MMHYVYYLLEPKTFNLMYIGRGLKPEVRQQAFARRHGVQTIMGICQRYSDFESACKAELIAIKKHRPPYNKSIQSSSGRFGKVGVPISDWHRAQLSKAHTGRVVSAETRQKKRLAALGHKHSQTTKDLIASIRRGSKQSPETVAKRMATIKRNRGISSRDFKE